MSNYLPVLLYSVGAVPDDSSLTTLPRGQVDYLSHDWEEEDVWRSWRNMTRQKNEIANGVRLENASWRTWWKQRNKLKTISPETLNWLKDSDVTWLYGPLHTAVEWTPPPKPKPDQTEHRMASAHDRLDLSEPKHKSILKYRSISEMLTGDLPFSPAESDEEAEHKLSQEVSDADSSTSTTRPSLSHTKSDTHVTRWGSNRAARKNSPEPTGSANPTLVTLNPSPPHVYSATNLSGYFASHIGEQSSSSPTPGARSSTEVTPTGSTSTKKKHITFNTFVEQCIAIDKPKPKESTSGPVVTEDESDWYSKHKASYDDGYDEDGEDGFDGDWGLNECAIGTDSESDVEQIRDEIAVDDEEEEEEDFIQMGSRRDSFNNKKNAKLRSTSKASTSSSSSASSGAEHSPSSASVPSSNKPRPSNIRRRRRSGGPNHVHLPRKGPPSLVRNGSSTALSSLSSSDKDKDMVSIAPIAPTMLKTGTGGGHTSWDGFGIHGVQSPYLNPAVGDWAEGFGDEGFSDDGGTMRFGPGGARLYFGHNSSDSEGGTPVGLVYMPPASSRYGSATLPRVSSKSSLNSEAEVELREDANQRDADNIELGDNMGSAKETAGMKKPYHHHEAYFSIESDKDGVLGTRSSVPIVVHTPAAELARGRLKADKDAYDYFGGPDLEEDFAQRKTKSSARRKTSAGDDAASFPVSIKDEGQTLAVDEERRSRSRSRSRTPSPSYSPQSQSSTSAITVPGRTEPAHSLPSSSSLLYPPQRGRGTVTPQDPPSSSRGRTSSLLPERSRSRSNHSSPIGSLSPEGIGSAYSANGRGGGDRERDRERSNRTSGRGRERTERRLTHSVSPEASESINSQVVGPDASVSSSSSGSRTIVPLPVTRSSERSSSPADILSDEDLTRSSHPTPSSSPVISMSGAAHAIARMNSEPPLSISDPQVLSPRLSYNVEPTNFLIPSHSPSTLSNDKASLQSPSSCRSAADDASVVGKAVGMVSSAGAYLGFWNNGTSQ